MSGTQSTLTDRTPSILNKEPTERKAKNDKSSVSLKQEFDPTGLVQRCVIIQRDENGFGLTVSGDNPVFVQLVKEDGAAMRAGVQTGDRIIKVNGTLVTQSNHIEVVKLIKSGSYVALTVLGRPPGLPQIHLEEHDDEEEEHEKDEGEEEGNANQMVQKSPGGQRHCSAPCSPEAHPASLLPDGDGATVSWMTEAEEGDHGVSSPSDTPNEGLCANNNTQLSGGGPGPVLPETGEMPRQSSDDSRRDGLNSCSSPDAEDAPDKDTSAQCIVVGPPYLLHPQIIGAEDDYFDSQQEQINGQCSCFQSIDLLKCRPAHLAVFLHHVVSQFDPAPLLCFLYADIHKQTSSKENRRFFMEFHSLFMDRTANLKVPVPDAVAAELEKRRLELIPEEVCKQYTQTLQDSLLTDLHKNLDDFRQKRSMGLTLAEDELSKIDSDNGGKDPVAWERECSCAEHILSKIEDILFTSQPTEEDKCQTMQYVILTYMKHLGVKVKEPRGLEQKRARINFLPKIKKSIKPEKEGEEKVRKPRFPNILVPPRRLSRVDSTSVGKAVEVNKQRSPKLLSQAAFGIPEPPDLSPSNSGRIRGNQLSEGSDTGSHVSPFASSTHSSPTALTSDTSGQDSDTNVSPFSFQPRLGEVLASSDHQDGVSSPTSTQFDFSPSNLEHLQEEGDQDTFRMEVQCAVSTADVQSEDDQVCEAESEEDPLNWQSLVSRDVLASLTAQEIKRQEVINELFYTERAHLRMLKVLDGVFYQRLSRDAVLPAEDIKNIFTNLEEIIQLHVSLTEQMAAIRKRSETSVIGQIGEDLLAWFSGEEEEKIKRAVATFCSNQPSALELIKTKKKKDQRFTLFMREAERNRLCRRLQLKDIIPVEMQRATKYPLLLEKIAKYTEGDEEDADKVRKAGECCKQILNHVNQVVKEAENKQRLVDYQRRLDISSLKPNENPLILELRNLDLTKRTMVHEGPLSWKVNKDKKIDLYTLLLEDILVLLQKQDERLLLKFHSKNVASVADTKLTFSPVIKLNTVLVRPVATNKESFFVLSMSDNGAQIYELTAQSVSDQRTWQCLITQCADAMKAKSHSSDAPPTPSEGVQDAIEIINCGMEKSNKDGNEPSESSDIQAPPTTLRSPFDGMKSEDEEEVEVEAEEPSVVERQEEEEEEVEVDEEELEAFLDGHLGDRLSFLQEGCRQGIAVESGEGEMFASPPSKAEEALRTLVMLKQVLFNHLMASEAKEVTEENSEGPGCQMTSSPETPKCPSAGLEEGGACESSQKDDTQTERNGGFVVLDPGGASEDDDGEDTRIDMSKLLSSSSQTDGGGPNLSRQLMTHLRLLQADLQYLKEVEMKYKQLQRTLTDTPTDSDNDGIQ
ncbi:rho guanine nucleotide exchange factor 12 isoform X2 [Dunckerocampus dactyliophorus]|uniref:rho guanine nucleotide exchange factor 12 isoform X2 n=1 Tax=Dunckerocampus dactyliophorus TaxID=161453 RepID=UPI0024051582|nr:rho guanine nucleotide exchange factor 12 isoform X2 [Dunckerocampus dactyliophorus]